jgi:LuxR family transcriptional regulator, quorum-sensing system regulator CviR
MSSRQITILRWMAEGKTNWEISHMISPIGGSVDYNLRKIYERLGVVSRTHAVAKALRLGIIK